MNSRKLLEMPSKSKSRSGNKQSSTKSTAKGSSMSLAKQWLIRFSEKHTESSEQYERWMNK